MPPTAGCSIRTPCRSAASRDTGAVPGRPETRQDAAGADRHRPGGSRTSSSRQEEAARAPYLAAFNRFCSVFPDAFYIAERGRMFDDDPGDKGRLLSAGFHNSMGYFRDDTPLMELILDENGRRELDRLWLDFDIVAFVPERMHLEFFLYERAESGTITEPGVRLRALGGQGRHLRREDQAAGRRLPGEGAQEPGEGGGEPVAIQAIEDHFRQSLRQHPRRPRRRGLAAEPAHLKALARLRPPRLPPPAHGGGAGQTCWPSTGRCGRRKA